MKRHFNLSLVVGAYTWITTVLWCDRGVSYTGDDLRFASIPCMRQSTNCFLAWTDEYRDKVVPAEPMHIISCAVFLAIACPVLLTTHAYSTPVGTVCALSVNKIIVPSQPSLLNPY